MKVAIERHGGLAAGIRRPPQYLDSDRLSQEESQELARRVAALGSAPPPEGAAPGRARDAISYTITVEQGDSVQRWRQSDGHMSEAFAALLEWIESHTDSRA